MNRTPGKVPVIRALPSIDEMAASMSDDTSLLLNSGSDVQRAARLALAHDSRRMSEAVKRGMVAIDLQDADSVKTRTQEFLRACEISARPALWTGLIASFGLSRQYVHVWLTKHPEHESTRFLLCVRDMLADALAANAIAGSVAPIPSIFALKAVFGWKDAGEDDLHDVGAEDGDALDLRQILARYEGQEAAEGASGALDDAEDV